MKTLIPVIDKNIKSPLYLQIYEYIKEAIFNQNIKPNDKLPSLRSLARNLGISITTIEQAYEQLLVEGYVYAKPNSGYYVKAKLDQSPLPTMAAQAHQKPEVAIKDNPYYYDDSCFSFERYKKCLNKIINEHRDALYAPSDNQGELSLRQEIARYVYQARGVVATEDQVVIGAGTQQLMSLIAMLLKQLDINVFVVENPSYTPVIDIFKNTNFSVMNVSVRPDGVDLDQLPTNIPCILYTAPSNQFPTGAFMPIDRRIEAINWANRNSSYIIEDDYDSELRYLTKPVPAMQGLDTKSQSIIYLGSFSSTMYQSFRISYMILPNSLVPIYDRIKLQYNQTCSKLEQLAMGVFMNNGDYQKGIKKMRKLYADKQNLVLKLLSNYPQIKLTNRTTGIALGIQIESTRSPEAIVALARGCKIKLRSYETNGEINYLLYYNFIPKEQIAPALEMLLKKV